MLVATPKSEIQLQQEADKIAEIIQLTQIDQRPALYRKIAHNLAARFQGYTAKIFMALASGEET